jgi:hypothetical protein
VKPEERFCETGFCENGFCENAPPRLISTSNIGTNIHSYASFKKKECLQPPSLSPVRGDEVRINILIMVWYIYVWWRDLGFSLLFNYEVYTSALTIQIPIKLPSCVVMEFPLLF